jgi:hypothetical protein
MGTWLRRYAEGSRERSSYVPEAASLRPVPSVCWTAKQPPNGPATAVLRQRTVQMSPVDAEDVEC